MPYVVPGKPAAYSTGYADTGRMPNMKNMIFNHSKRTMFIFITVTTMLTMFFGVTGSKAGLMMVISCLIGLIIAMQVYTIRIRRNVLRGQLSSLHQCSSQCNPDVILQRLQEWASHAPVYSSVKGGPERLRIGNWYIHLVPHDAPTLSMETYGTSTGNIDDIARELLAPERLLSTSDEITAPKQRLLPDLTVYAQPPTRTHHIGKHRLHADWGPDYAMIAYVEPVQSHELIIIANILETMGILQHDTLMDATMLHVTFWEVIWDTIESTPGAWPENHKKVDANLTAWTNLYLNYVYNNIYHPISFGVHGMNEMVRFGEHLRDAGVPRSTLNTLLTYNYGMFGYQPSFPGMELRKLLYFNYNEHDNHTNVTYVDLDVTVNVTWVRTWLQKHQRTGLTGT